MQTAIEFIGKEDTFNSSIFLSYGKSITCICPRSELINKYFSVMAKFIGNISIDTTFIF